MVTMHVFDGKNWISFFSFAYFRVLPSLCVRNVKSNVEWLKDFIACCATVARVRCIVWLRPELAQTNQCKLCSFARQSGPEMSKLLHLSSFECQDVETKTWCDKTGWNWMEDAHWKCLMPNSHCVDFFSQREIQDQLEFQLFHCETAHRKLMVFEWETSSVFTLARNLQEMFLSARKNPRKCEFGFTPRVSSEGVLPHEKKRGLSASCVMDVICLRLIASLYLSVFFPPSQFKFFFIWATVFFPSTVLTIYCHNLPM